MAQGVQHTGVHVQGCLYLQTLAQVWGDQLLSRSQALLLLPSPCSGSRSFLPFSLTGYIPLIIYAFNQMHSLKTYGTTAHVLNATLHALTSSRSCSNTANLLNLFANIFTSISLCVCLNWMAHRELLATENYGCWKFTWIQKATWQIHRRKDHPVH